MSSAGLQSGPIRGSVPDRVALVPAIRRDCASCAPYFAQFDDPVHAFGGIVDRHLHDGMALLDDQARGLGRFLGHVERLGLPVDLKPVVAGFLFRFWLGGSWASSGSDFLTLISGRVAIS